MIKYFAGIALCGFSYQAFACGAEADMRTEALRALYSDVELTRYVCVENNDCAFDEFARRVDVQPVTLSPAPAAPAIQVEPQHKGLQYFSAIFVQDQCKYRMVFAPDTTFSGVKVLKQQRNHYYVLQAVERDSAEAWKEYDFAYDPKERQYGLASTRCYEAHGTRNVAVSCD